MKRAFLTLFSILSLAFSAAAQSDLACSPSQNANEASQNIAVLIARGYEKSGQSFKQVGSLEVLDVGQKLIVTRSQGVYSVSVKPGATLSNQKIFQALLKVNLNASKKLSQDDVNALNECTHLLGSYVGVAPQQL